MPASVRQRSPPTSPPPVPVYTKTPAPQPTYNWTGFYLGVHAGGIWSSSTDNVTPGNSAAVTFFVPPGQLATSLPLSSGAFIGGGQLGYNWQINPMWVAGFEADFSGTDLGNKVSLPAPDGGTRMMTANETLDWFGTIRGRIGVTPTDRALWYFTGGLAYAHTNLATTLTRTTGCSGNNCQAGAVSGTKTGWTIGGRPGMGLRRQFELQNGVPLLRPWDPLSLDDGPVLPGHLQRFRRHQRQHRACRPELQIQPVGSEQT
jgi:outer membrane immunogenic protein